MLSSKLISILQHTKEIGHNLGLKNDQIYIVGGFLRDYLLQRESADVDLLVLDQVKKLAVAVANKVDATFITLDDARQVYRLVLKKPFFQIDFVGPKGKTLREDLLKRDFTINALAISLDDFLVNPEDQGGIVDLFQGLVHLQQKRITVVSVQTMLDDPLRILRGLRIACELGFAVSNNTLELMKEAKKEITRVSPERVRDELWQILEQDRAALTIDILAEDLNVLQKIMPVVENMNLTQQNHYHVENVWRHSLRVLKTLEEIIQGKQWPKALDQPIMTYLQEKIGGDKNRLPLLKYTTLFHDVGKIKTYDLKPSGRITFYGHAQVGAKMIRDISESLCLSNQESLLSSLWVEHHMDSLFLYKEENINQRLKNRLYYRNGKETLGVLLLSLADVTATYIAKKEFAAQEKFSQFIYHLMQEYLEKKTEFDHLAKLVSGEDVMKLLNITKGKEVGRWLNKIMDLQVDGLISNRQEALDFLQGNLHGVKNKS